MTILEKIYNFILSRGLSKADKKDKELIQFLNMISFLSFIGGISVFCIALFFTDDYIYISFALLAGIMYLMIIILQHFNYTKESRLYFSLIVPLWYSLGILVLGGNFGQAIATATTIIVTNLLFSSNPKLNRLLLIYNSLLYLLPTLYISFYEPFLGVNDYPFDDILVFLLSIGWICIIAYIYESKTKMYIESLEDKNNILQQKTAELERFNYIASHDLKSPLTNILNFLGLIKKRITQEKFDELPQYLNYAESSTHQMKELIEGVLEISKYNEDQQKGNYESIDLDNSLKKAIYNIQQEVCIKNAAIKITNTLPSYPCKETDFIIVFQNLIQNAIKYNKSKRPRITISSHETDQELILSFKDNGIGIAEENCTEIFEYFKRLHNKDEFKGTGLGLGLCKKIIDKYNGQISVSSVLGSYSNFIIVLPIKKRMSIPKQEEEVEMILQSS